MRIDQFAEKSKFLNQNWRKFNESLNFNELQKMLGIRVAECHVFFFHPRD